MGVRPSLSIFDLWADLLRRSAVNSNFGLIMEEISIDIFNLLDKQPSRRAAMCCWRNPPLTMLASSAR